MLKSKKAHEDPVAKLNDDDKAVYQALTGEAGFSRVALMSDREARAGWRKHLGATLDLLPNDKQLVRLEIFSAVGLTDAKKPFIFMRTFMSKTAKALKGFDAIVAESSAVCKVCDNLAERRILVWMKALVILDALANPEARIDALLASVGRTHPGVPQSWGEVIEPSDRPAAAAWFCKPVDKMGHVVPDDEGRLTLALKGKPMPKMALRLVELRSQIPIEKAMTGVGKLGRKLVQDLRSKVAAAQKARVEKGMILPKDYDLWGYWCLVHQTGITGTALPFRFDAKLALPKAVKRGLKKGKAKSERSRRLAAMKKLRGPKATRAKSNSTPDD